MKTQSIQLVAILGTLAAACGEGVVPAAEAVESRAGALYGGELSGTFARPAIGQMCNASNSICCTATLVDPRYILTAAHCFDFQTGPFTGTFSMTDTSGTNIAPTSIYNFTYSIGAYTPAGDDVAFARLTAPVPLAAAAPIPIAPALPADGTVVTVFGFGATSVVYVDGGSIFLGGGFKQAITYNSQNTRIQLPGDSGGPRVFGTANGGGAIWGVNSGYTITTSGFQDVVANAPFNATPGLRGVLNFGGSSIFNAPLSQFASFASQTSVKAVTGFFNADGLSDIALVGGSSWTTVPIAFSNGAGGFTFTNTPIGSGFPGFAQHARSAVAGDFDHNGLTDIALLGGAGWNTIPIAFRQANGTFTVTNLASGSFAGWSQATGAVALGGDFNGDGFGDIALVGGQGWSTIPVAFSRGNGTFDVRNVASPMASWAQQFNVKPIAGDFNGDRATDIALTGNSGWNTIPTGFSDRAGGFDVHNNIVDNFPYWASLPGVKVVAGDFDGDGDDDLAATGNTSWVTIPFALSRRDSFWDPANMPINFPNLPFPSWGSQAPFVLAGRLDAGTTTDIMLTGTSGWSTIPLVQLRP